MKSIATKDLVPGVILGREIMSAEGIVLLERGICLTAPQISSLRTWGVPFIYIQEEQAGKTGSRLQISLTRGEFLKEYSTTIKAVRETFEHIRQTREVPVSWMRDMVDQTVIVMVNTVGVLYYLHEVQRHSDYTFQHSVNVAVVSGILAKWMGYPLEEKQNIILAGLLHDIGKVFIPLPILDKPSKLSFFEYETVKKHPQEGHRLLEYTDQLPRAVKLGILQHHERMDGSGYPFGFKTDEIHEYARIVAVADIYDAMVSNRAYRRKLSPLTAAKTITEEMYNKLDAAVCMSFLSNMRNYFTGNRVLLSNGLTAKIVFVESGSWTTPLVQTPDGTVIDLKKDKTVSIVDFIEDQGM